MTEPSVPMPEIHRATSASDLDAARRLFRAYLNELDVDLDFQDVEAELSALPGPYAAPEGALLLAWTDETPVGVVAVKPLAADGVCEMKRLYVRPTHRRQGIGHALGTAVLDTAREIGYDVMRLDTLASMTSARSLYRALGFEERSAYYHNPLPDVVYMERQL